MNAAVEQILERNRVTHEVEGIEFLCHRWNTQLAIEAFGAGAFALVQDGETSQVKVKAEAVGDQRQMIEKVLGVVMISPALGDEDDPENDVLCMRSLGDLSYNLFEKVIGGDADKAAGFLESSPGKTG